MTVGRENRADNGATFCFMSSSDRLISLVYSGNVTVNRIKDDKKQIKTTTIIHSHTLAFKKIS